MRRILYVAVGLCVAGLTHAQTAEDFFKTIRANDLETLRHLSAVNVKDRLNNTPLHYAALYGSAESVRILLDHGADIAARNTSEATPLVYAAYNFEKTRLLVEKGSDVNAAAKAGMRPLMIAASVHGNSETVRYLIEKGADVKALAADGSDALQIASYKGDIEMIRLLLQKGADPKRADEEGYTALINASAESDGARIQTLVAAGSDVNAANKFAGKVKNGPIDLVRLTPLFLAASESDPATIKTLLNAGAHANATDGRQFTPLMAAVFTDEPKLATIRELIAAGTDVNAHDRNGETVMDWALKYKNPEVIAILREAGAKTSKPYTAPVRPASFEAGAPKDAILRSQALLVKSGQAFFTEGGGCVGCHHQPADARVYASLRAAEVHPDEHLRRIFLDGMVARRPQLLSGLPLQMMGGGDFDELEAEIQAMVDLGEPASPVSDAILHYLAARQNPSGAWVGSAPRPPLNASSISRTTIAIRGLKTYGWPARRQEFDERIARARKFLLNARPNSPLEEADRILGLNAAGVPDRELETAVQSLISKQHADGGWGQTRYLDSDAYATGNTLWTLHQAGFLKASDPVYARGVAYLLKTQFPDGSWYVRSRGPKLQPYFQSNFPFDHDQWISYTATALAVMALAPAAQ